MAIDNSICAFPVPAGGAFRDGMSLRDYFAAASMPVIGYRMEMLNANWTAQRIALVAYQIADAMLSAREQEGGLCEHGIADGYYCATCNAEYKAAEESQP